MIRFRLVITSAFSESAPMVIETICNGHDGFRVRRNLMHQDHLQGTHRIRLLSSSSYDLLFLYILFEYCGFFFLLFCFRLISLSRCRSNVEQFACICCYSVHSIGFFSSRLRNFDSVIRARVVSQSCRPTVYVFGVNFAFFMLSVCLSSSSIL